MSRLKGRLATAPDDVPGIAVASSTRKGGRKVVTCPDCLAKATRQAYSTVNEEKCQVPLDHKEYSVVRNKDGSFSSRALLQNWSWEICRQSVHSDSLNKLFLQRNFEKWSSKQWAGCKGELMVDFITYGVMSELQGVLGPVVPFFSGYLSQHRCATKYIYIY